MAWTTYYTHRFLWDVITHPCPNFNVHIWGIPSHCVAWLWLLIRAIICFSQNTHTFNDIRFLSLYVSMVRICWRLNHMVQQVIEMTLQWRYNDHDSVSNHQPHDCLHTVYSGVDQSKHQSSASLAFVWRIHRGPVNSPHKWPVTRKVFPFDDVIMRAYEAMDLFTWLLGQQELKNLPPPWLTLYHQAI